MNLNYAAAVFTFVLMFACGFVVGFGEPLGKIRLTSRSTLFYPLACFVSSLV